MEDADKDFKKKVEAHYNRIHGDNPMTDEEGAILFDLERTALPTGAPRLSSNVDTYDFLPGLTDRAAGKYYLDVKEPGWCHLPLPKPAQEREAGITPTMMETRSSRA